MEPYNIAKTACALVQVFFQVASPGYAAANLPALLNSPTVKIVSEEQAGLEDFLRADFNINKYDIPIDMETVHFIDGFRKTEVHSIMKLTKEGVEVQSIMYDTAYFEYSTAKDITGRTLQIISYYSVSDEDHPETGYAVVLPNGATTAHIDLYFGVFDLETCITNIQTVLARQLKEERKVLPEEKKILPRPNTQI